MISADVIIRFLENNWTSIWLFIPLAIALGVAAIRPRWRSTLWFPPLIACLMMLNIGWHLDRDVTVAMLSGLLALLREVNQATSPFLGLTAIVAGAIAGWEAISSLNRAALDTAADAFLHLREKYHSDDTRTAIETLVDFAYPIKKEITDTWNSKLRAGNFEAIGQFLSPALERLTPSEREKIKSAARRITGYFDDVGFLFKHGIIRGRLMKFSFVNVPGLNIFYEVCVPMYSIKNQDSPSIEYAHLLRGVLKRQGEGMKKY